MVQFAFEVLVEGWGLRTFFSDENHALICDKFNKNVDVFIVYHMHTSGDEKDTVIPYQIDLRRKTVIHPYKVESYKFVLV